MAEPLKNMFGPEMVHRTAAAIAPVFDEFDGDGFTATALDGFEDLELTPRCRQIAAALAEYLPDDRERAINILVDSLGPELPNCDPSDAPPTGDAAVDENPMAAFIYISYGYFLADHGGDHFDAAIRANYEITKRASSEFSIRTPLRDHTEATLEVLKGWAVDDNVHVRRCVSEGTRPRLPWSFRLKVFQDDPTPVIELLELLKDDPVEYVRRSVANNLNDIAKDHPDLVVEVAQRWWADGDDNRRRLVRHGLRTLIKAGDPGALDVLGFGADSPAQVGEVSMQPDSVAVGGKVKISVTIENPSAEPCGALVDLRVHFVKASGKSSPKVFKGAELLLGAGESAVVSKTVSVAQHSTRKHYPGEHAVEVMINGTARPIGSFTIAE
ncbi:MAG: DNA alkylation repair protein [Acidimicrobiales bacterium]